MDKKEFDAKITELEKQKNELIAKIKEVNGKIRFKERQLGSFGAQSGGEGNTASAGRLRRELERAEFGIATAAYTAKMEKEMIKQVKEIEGQLKGAVEQEKKRRKLFYIQQDLEAAKALQGQIDEQLKKIRGELDSAYESARRTNRDAEQGKRRDEGFARRAEFTKKKRQGFDEENAQYLKPIDKFVSMEEICEIKKKTPAN